MNPGTRPARPAPPTVVPHLFVRPVTPASAGAIAGTPREAGR